MPPRPALIHLMLVLAVGCDGTTGPVLQVRPEGGDGGQADAGPRARGLLTVIPSTGGFTVRDAVVDDAGNAYLTGWYDGATDFGDGVIRTAPAEAQLFVASFDETLALRWALATEAAGLSQGWGLIVGQEVEVTGLFRGMSSFGAMSLDSGGYQQVSWLGLTSTDGSVTFARGYGAGANAQGHDLARLPSGATILSGVYGSQLDLGGGVALAEAPGDLGFVAVLEPATQAPRWAVSLVANGTVIVEEVGADAEGQVYAAGRAAGAIDPGDGSTIAPAGAGDNGFLISYGPDASVRWSRSFGGAGGELVADLLVEEEGSWVVGRSSPDADFGQGIEPGFGDYDGFLARYRSADGVLEQVLLVGGSGADTVRRIMPDGQGGWLAVGRFEATAQFGDHVLEAEGAADGFVMRLTPEGAVDWVLPAGGSGTATVMGLAIADGGSTLVLTGQFGGSLRIGEETAEAEGDTDAFIYRQPLDS